MKPINPTKALYIKLGVTGKHEEECIKRNKIMIDYIEIDHNFCLNGDWKRIERQIRELGWGGTNNHLRQIKDFYESREDVLWITFYANKLWWCFTENKIYKYSDGRKYKKVIGKWHDTNIKGDKLSMSKLSGRLLATQGYRGTICKVRDEEYVINKINSKTSNDVNKISNDLNKLKSNLIKIIENLNPYDFEVLVDLIFYYSGWRRVGAIGKVQKGIDLDLINILTKETAIVQIKSSSNKAEFKRYFDIFKEINANKKFFIVNSCDNFKIPVISDNITIYYGEDLADLVIRAGLIDWVVDKAVWH